jgi:rhamnose utilization protein RhaD (predicted bifunctional aldolase and dehydrogenase)
MQSQIFTLKERAKNMYQEEKDKMERISNYVGKIKAYVQGGGGNTSIKFDDTLMAIKASGYTLQEVTADQGYVIVDYQKIRQYYNTINKATQKDYEKESLEVGLNSIVSLDKKEQKRPSVEVGFHSFLKRCVIHTHSVYANVLCCSEEGQQKAAEIFIGSGFNYLFIPYINPGFELTLAIKEAMLQENDIIFLENHGVIVHNDDDIKTIKIHEEMNMRIKEYFNIPEFPQPRIRQAGEIFISDTLFLKEFIINNKVNQEYFSTLNLYPDQLVYIGRKMGHLIRIDNNGGISYYTGNKEAQAIEETLLGVLFIIDMIKKSGLTLKQMKEEDAFFINNWESEKYRSQLIK